MINSVLRLYVERSAESKSPLRHAARKLDLPAVYAQSFGRLLLDRPLFADRTEIEAFAGDLRSLFAIMTSLPSGLAAHEHVCTAAREAMATQGIILLLGEVHELAERNGKITLWGTPLDVILRHFVAGELLDDQAGQDVLDTLIRADRERRTALFLSPDGGVYASKRSACRCPPSRRSTNPGTSGPSPAARVGPWCKPRIGSSSAGVRVLEGPQDLSEGVEFGEPMLARSYDPRPIHHIDGIFDGTRIARLRVSRYLNACLGFREGTFPGSVEVDDADLVRAVQAAATSCLAVLTDAMIRFHLELFAGSGPEGTHCSFLEVGARVGGAETPFIWRDLHGYDLMRAAFDIRLGRALTAAGAPPIGEVGGWLLVPAPAARPCLITHVTSMSGLTPGPYAEVVLSPGGILPEADACYEHVGGRLRFRGPDRRGGDRRPDPHRDPLPGQCRTDTAGRARGPGGERPRPVTYRAHRAHGGDPMKDYSEQILDGEGENDYTRYMRTDALLSLQRRPEEWVHRDEMLFQIVHQSTELWLKLACAEVAEATLRIEAGELDTATRLLGRAALGGRLVTQQLEMMRQLAPWDFQTIRTILGHGSGADSPGWRAVRSHSRVIGAAFDKLVADRGIDLAEVYRTGEDTPEYRLAEALIEWDDRISIWRVQHFKVLTRIIGHQSVGTQGTPVDGLAKLISHKLFPELWRLRTELTATGPMGDQPVRDGL